MFRVESKKILNIFFLELASHFKRQSLLTKQRTPQRSDVCEDQADQEESIQKGSIGLFFCPQCPKRFSSHKYLSFHLSGGKHDVQRITLHDFMLSASVEAINTSSIGIRRASSLPYAFAPSFGPLPPNLATLSLPQEGWAVKPPPQKHEPLTLQMRSFLVDLFNRGIGGQGRPERGQKVSAARAERLMKEAKNDEGKNLFTVSECLGRQRIRQFFSSCQQKLREKTYQATVCALDSLVQNPQTFASSTSIVSTASTASSSSSSFISRSARAALTFWPRSSR
eukprot:Pompholyxophrys_sp_v1_NODE_97_length_2040_cov_8.574811.p1 type:complete len:281 gc:universal NODE_97_length_2040_cov_8.574811:904-62(-)